VFLGFFAGLAAMPWWGWLIIVLLLVVPFLAFFLVKPKGIKVEFVVDPRKRSFFQFLKKDELLIEPTDFKREGFVIEGWYLKDKNDAKHRWNFATKVDKEMTLFANWTRERPGGPTGGTPVAAEDYSLDGASDTVTA